MNREKYCPKCKNDLLPIFSRKIYPDFSQRDCTLCPQLTDRVVVLKMEAEIMKKKIFDLDNKYLNTLTELEDKDAEIRKLQAQLVQKQKKPVTKRTSEFLQLHEMYIVFARMFHSLILLQIAEIADTNELFFFFFSLTDESDSKRFNQRPNNTINQTHGGVLTRSQAKALKMTIEENTLD